MRWVYLVIVAAFLGAHGARAEDPPARTIDVLAGGIGRLQAQVPVFENELRQLREELKRLRGLPQRFEDLEKTVRELHQRLDGLDPEGPEADDDVEPPALEYRVRTYSERHLHVSEESLELSVGCVNTCRFEHLRRSRARHASDGRDLLDEGELTSACRPVGLLLAIVTRVQVPQRQRDPVSVVTESAVAVRVPGDEPCAHVLPAPVRARTDCGDDPPPRSNACGRPVRRRGPRSRPGPRPSSRRLVNADPPAAWGVGNVGPAVAGPLPACCFDASADSGGVANAWSRLGRLRRPRPAPRAVSRAGCGTAEVAGSGAGACGHVLPYPCMGHAFAATVPTVLCPMR